MNSKEQATHAAELLVRQRYREVAAFVERYYGERIHTDEDIRRALQQIEAMAAHEHSPDVQSGMRRARIKLAEELLTDND